VNGDLAGSGAFVRRGNEPFRAIQKRLKTTANPLSPVRIRAAPLGETV